MAGIALTPEQDAAVLDLARWWRDPCAPQVFTIAGYAGTGKSSLVAYAIEALGIKPQHVAYVTYTGKASLVLRAKGCPAQTIHSFCYRPRLKRYVGRDGLPKSKVAGFDLTRDAGKVKLIVLDECSMVSRDLVRDLMSFKVRIIALGDPAQLPPVRGASNGLLAKPRVFLTKIHRQAAGNPIIWASMLAREGRPIPYGVHGGVLRVIPAAEVGLEHVLASQQTIACTHDNRKQINKSMREFLCVSGLPTAGERLVCLKNNWDIASSVTQTPLINGLLLDVIDEPTLVRRKQRTVHLNLHAEGAPTDAFYDIDANLDFFEPLAGVQPDTDGMMDHFDFGYAITTHRSQGSEWDDVLFIADLFGDTTTRQQLLYTGITRASKKLILAR